MGIVRATAFDPHERGDKRQRQRSQYSHKGKKVCLFAFLYLENITVYHLKKVKLHMQKNGVVSIEHGNSHKTPHNAFPLDIYQSADEFLRSYLKLGSKKSSTSRPIAITQPLVKIYQEYKAYDKASPVTMGYTTFRVFFRKRFPNVKLTMQPAKAATTSATAVTASGSGGHVEETALMDTNDLIYYDEEEATTTGGEEEVLEDIQYDSTIQIEVIESSRDDVVIQ